MSPLFKNRRYIFCLVFVLFYSVADTVMKIYEFVESNTPVSVSGIINDGVEIVMFTALGGVAGITIDWIIGFLWGSGVVVTRCKKDQRALCIFFALLFGIGSTLMVIAVHIGMGASDVIKSIIYGSIEVIFLMIFGAIVGIVIGWVNNIF